MSDANIDGCDVDMTLFVTEDGEQTDGLVMFGDCWGDLDAIETRRRELVEWDAAAHPSTDDLPTTGAPGA